MNPTCGALTVVLASACVRPVDDNDFPRPDDPHTSSKCTPAWCISKEVPLAGHDLRAVWADGPGEAWATDLFGRVFHYDASGWTANEDIDWFGAAAIWGASADDVWIAGERVRHWDGSSWHTSDLVTAGWQAVWGTASDDVWIGGHAGGLEHWDGVAWTSFGWSQASGYTIMGMWGSAPSDMWIVGDLGYSHWDGRTVSAPVHTLSQVARGIWGFASDDIWVVGDFGTIGHFDGSTWSEVNCPTTYDLNAIWGSAPNDIWAVGDVGTILHWDGTQWSRSSSGVHEPLFGIWGTGTGDVWAAGSTVILHHGVRSRSWI